jgi:hypothetical protein
MRIERNRSSNKLHFSQEKYIEKVLCKFMIHNAAHFKLSKKQCPTTDEKKKEMQHVPYALGHPQWGR